jgi:hypothetical protein
MIYNCENCGNNVSELFTQIKTGLICMKCLKDDIKFIPQNAAEKARLEIYEYISKRKTDGRIRKYATGYRAMIRVMDSLEALPEKTEDQKTFIKGFCEAIRVFHENS